MPGPITSIGYTLHITNNAEICDFVLNVQGDDGKQYHLYDRGANKNKKTVKKALAKLGDRWTDVDFDFEADASRVITDIL